MIAHGTRRWIAIGALGSASLAACCGCAASNNQSVQDAGAAGGGGSAAMGTGGLSGTGAMHGVVGGAGEGGSAGSRSKLSACVENAPCDSAGELCSCEDASSPSCHSVVRCQNCCADSSCAAALRSPCAEPQATWLVWKPTPPAAGACQATACPASLEQAEGQSCEPKGHVCEYAGEVECACDSQRGSQAHGACGIGFSPLVWRCAPVVGSPCSEPDAEWSVACTGALLNPYYRRCVNGLWATPQVQCEG